jgi:hypothetical protein
MGAATNGGNLATINKPEKDEIKFSINNEQNVIKHLEKETRENMSLIFYDFNEAGRKNKRGSSDVNRIDANQSVNK